MSETRLKKIIEEYERRSKDDQDKRRFIQDIARRNTPRLSEEQVLSYYRR